MEFFYWDGSGSIDIDENEIVNVTVDGNDTLKQLLESEILKGIMDGII